MAVDFDAVRSVVEDFSGFSPEYQKAYLAQADELAEFLAEELPALFDTDRATVAWIIARIMSTLRHKPVSDVGTIITSTSVGYALVAAKGFGVEIPEVAQ